jgi:TRAP-type mannitol/chloroaromatic compound transport system permease small subunit
LNTFEKVLQSVTEKMATVAMVAIVACMLLVTSDVVKRAIVIVPIPGTFEMVELIAALVLSMGIGYLTFVKGHVSVGIIVDRFSPRTQAIFDLIGGAISLGFTAWLTSAMFAFATLTRIGGGVTGHLLIPLYPFIYLVAVALALTCVVFIRDIVKAVIGIRKGGGA